jgi:hypothetical protein
MADVQAIFGILIALGIAYPGMLTTWWLLFPNLVGRVQVRLERSPWTNFWVGLFLTGIYAIPTGVMLALPFGPAKLVGWIMLALLLAVAGIGAAGLAAHLGSRLALRSRPELSPSAAFLRGAVALELAGFFPLIGWFLFIPLSTIACLGAVALALVRRSASQPALSAVPDSLAARPAAESL